MSKTTTVTNPEYQYEIAMFGIKTLSNLHVGSGSENYGIIDNLIQRDPASNFPCILSSSLKGALREYCRNYIGTEFRYILNDIFGTDKRDEDESENTEEEADGEDRSTGLKAGKYKFLQADILSMPLRGYNLPFFNTTCPWLLKNMLHKLNSFRKQLIPDGWEPLIHFPGLGEIGIHFGSGIEEVDLDDVHLKPVDTPSGWQPSNAHLGENIAILNDENFIELVSDYKLPVIARNTLNDGRSGNLWYEQVLPSDTYFAFIVLYPKNDSNFDTFKECITSHPIQIGANGSIGYGFCQLFEISLTNLSVES